MNDEGKYTPLLRQILVISGPIFLIFVGGIMNGFSSIMISQIKESGEYTLDTHSESWIASAPLILTGAACLLGGWCMDKLGRINIILLTAVLYSASYIIIYLSRNMTTLLLGRMLSGFCVGFGHTPVSCYMGEVSTPKYRAVFNAFVSLSLTFSFLTTDLLGICVTWRTLALISALLPLCILALSCAIPESHVTYLQKNDLENAARVFYWFRGRNDQSIAEFEELVHEGANENVGFKWENIYSRQFLKPLALMCMLFVTLQVSANNVVVFYSHNFVEKVIPGVNRNISVITIDLIRVVATSLGCILSKIMSLKRLLLICGLGATISIYLLALTNFLSESYEDYLVYRYLPLATLLLYTLFVNGGLFVIPWATVAEIFNKKTRGVGGGLSTCFNFLLMFAVIKVNPYMFVDMGVSFTLLTYATLTLIAVGISYVIMPETKDMTLEQIEEYYK